MIPQVQNDEMQCRELAHPSVEETKDFFPQKEYRYWWQDSVYYVIAGIRLCGKDMNGLISLVGIFLLPDLAAAIIGSRPGMIAYWLATVLPWISITLGNCAVVLAIDAIKARQPVKLIPILHTSIRWLPRYLWTNAITTILFWGLFTPLQWLLTPETSHWNWSWLIPSSLIPTLLLLLPMLFWHVRLVFATYATIIDDQPAIRSVIISIGIAQKRWRMVAAAFAGSMLVLAPITGPLYLLILHSSNARVTEGYTWALIMVMRPLFIATTCLIYMDYRLPYVVENYSVKLPKRLFSRILRLE